MHFLWRIFGKESRDGGNTLLSSRGFASSRWGIRGVERWVGVPQEMCSVPRAHLIRFGLEKGDGDNPHRSPGNVRGFGEE